MESMENFAVPTSILKDQPQRQPYNAPEDGLAQRHAGFAKFLKEHASPTHHRVTAGGRIVPMETNPAPPQFKLEINNLAHVGINPSARNVDESDDLAKKHITLDHTPRVTALNLNTAIGGPVVEGTAADFGSNQGSGFAYPFHGAPFAAFPMPGYGPINPSPTTAWTGEVHPIGDSTTAQSTEQGQSQTRISHGVPASGGATSLLPPMAVQANLTQPGLAPPPYLAAHYASPLGLFPALTTTYDPRGWFTTDYQVAYHNLGHLAPGMQHQQVVGQAVQPVPMHMTGIYNRPMTSLQAPNGAVYYTPVMGSAQLSASPYAPTAAANAAVTTHTEDPNEVSQESLEAAKREFDRLSDSLAHLDRHLAVNGPKIDLTMKRTFANQRMDLVVRRADAKKNVDRMEALLKTLNLQNTTIAGSQASFAVPIRPPPAESPSSRLNVKAPAWKPEHEAAAGDGKCSHEGQSQRVDTLQEGSRANGHTASAELSVDPPAWRASPKVSHRSTSLDTHSAHIDDEATSIMSVKDHSTAFIPQALEDIAEEHCDENKEPEVGDAAFEQLCLQAAAGKHPTVSLLSVARGPII